MRRLLIALAVLAWAQPSTALPVNIPVPNNAYLANYAGMGLDVAWAAPCRPIDPSCGIIDLSFQGPLGWRLATAPEATALQAVLVRSDFVFAGANVPMGRVSPNGARFQIGTPPGAAACAAPFFSTLHFHCDWGDGPPAFDHWAFGQPNENTNAEGIVVRNAVPEPGTLALFGLGALWLVASRRRRA